MSIEGLEEELQRVPVPASASARDHTILEARDRTRRIAVRRSMRLRITAVLGVVLAALVAVGALTPAGRSAAASVAELMGIGDESTLESHHHQDGRSVVVGTGEAPGGTRYEMVAYQGDTGHPCLALDWPTLDQPLTHTNSVCLDDRPLDQPVWPWGATAADQLKPQASLTLYGLAEPSVARVRVLYRDDAGVERQAPSDLARVSGELQREAGVSEPVDFFVAFLPAETLPSITVVGYGDGGEEIARGEFPAETLEGVGPPFGPGSG